MTISRSVIRVVLVAMVAAVVCGVVGANAMDERHVKVPLAPPREVTDAELGVLDEAEHLLVKRCMARKGFAYWAPAPLTADERKEFDYIVDDVTWASRHGYGSDIQAKMATVRSGNPNARYRSAISTDRRRAYDAAYAGTVGGGIEVELPSGITVGQLTGGCVSESDQILYGDVREWFRVSAIAGNLPSYADRMTRDPDFVRDVGIWSGCMRAKGMAFASPADARRFVSQRRGADLPALHREEIRIATAEARCAISSRLSSTVHALLRRNTAELRVQYGDEIDARNRMRLEALTRAHQILSSGG